MANAAITANSVRKYGSDNPAELVRTIVTHGVQAVLASSTNSDDRTLSCETVLNSVGADRPVNF